MPFHTPAETIHARGCRVSVRRVASPEAREIWLHCTPPAEVEGLAGQADAVYRALLEVLAAEGADVGSVVSERGFVRGGESASLRVARRVVIDAAADAPLRPAITTIEQPPVEAGKHIELLVHAVVPNSLALHPESLKVRSRCGCDVCAEMHALRVPVGRDPHLFAGSLCGPGRDAYEQTLAMFGVAEDLLQQADMSFRDVVRTWIHLREMDRDYASLNRARREFFAARGIDPPPASTGIGGAPMSREHDLSLGFHALPGRAAPRTVMTTPTLNEASQYGADFVRGMRVEECNKIALHVSGTASLDESGRSTHAGDFAAQVDRMLLNVKRLLEGQGASFADALFGITYLRNAADAPHARQKLAEAGCEGLPNPVVVAPICRPELLCEMELFAALPPVGAS